MQRASFLQMAGSVLFYSILSLILLHFFPFFLLFLSFFLNVVFMLHNSSCGVTCRVPGCRETNIFNNCIFPEMPQVSSPPVLLLYLLRQTELE